MAVKKTQMYRKNLDTSETNLYPLTEAQYVSMENGQTVQEILSDRDSDKYTPVITNSSSTFKVGQGDNVDLSSSMKEGAYDSCVLKGKTMVNCIQEPSSKDVVLPYEFADGQYVTINDTKESGALGVELKGQTLVNVHGKKAYGLSQSGETMEANKFTNIVKGENQLSFDMVDGLTYGWGSFVNGGSLNLDMLKPNTKYLVYFATVIFPEYFGVSFRNGDGTNSISTQAQINKGGNYAIITTTNEIVKSSQILYISIPQQHAGHYGFKDAMIIEYQEGMENWDIPYFEGMASCKMPILHTVGKNLLPPVRNTWYPCRFKQGTTFKLSTKDSVPSNGGNVVFKDINGTSVWFGIDSGNTTSTKVLPCDVYYIMNSLATGVEHQLEIGTQVTSYEPNKTSILSLPEEVVLRSLPNGVCDTFNTRTGVYTQRIKEIVFDGSNDEGWNVFTGDWVLENSTVFYTYISGVKGYTWSKYTGKEAISDKIPSYPDNWLRLNDVLGMTNDNTGARKQFRIPKSYLETDNVNGFRKWLEQNPVTACFELATPIITKVNLSSTLKSWNTTTHIYSEIQENTLYPTLSHSNPTYPVILKPSTKYSIVANSYSNNHTNSAINFNLGGATTSTTVGNRVTTITTPSTLSNELLTMSGRGNKLNNVMVIEGDVVGDEPYFEGICDCKSPILSNVGANIFDFKAYQPYKASYSNGYPHQTGDSIINYIKELENGFVFTTPTNTNHQGACYYVKVKRKTDYHISCDVAFTGTYSIKIFGIYTNEIPLTTAIKDNHRHLLNRDNLSTNTLQGEFNTKDFDCLLVYLGGAWEQTVTGAKTITFTNIQIKELQTPYEVYKSNTTTFDQKDDKTIVLRSLPSGVCDTLNVETGEYVQRIGEKVFDGSDNGWQVLTYPPHDNDTHYQFKYWFGENLIGGDLWLNAQSIIANTLPSASEALHWGSQGKYGIGGDRGHFMITWEKSSSPFHDVTTLNAWLQSNPVTVQYELATPIVSTIDVQGFPYAYTNGHVQLSSGSIEQSLTPKVEYSLSANKTGQINSNTKRVSAHQKQLDDFEAMMLTQMVQSAYDKAILQFDYEMQMMSLGGE